MKAKIYTKTGDLGQTGLVGGERVAKSNPRLEAYGTVDELNSVLGLIACRLANISDPQLQNRVRERLFSIQNNLFNIGSLLACEDPKLLPQLPALRADLLSELESDMDEWEAELPALKNFILPGGSQLSAYAHLGRTICRRAERETVRLHEETGSANSAIIFLNRLSDWLFVLARKFNFTVGVDDVIWQKE